MERSCELLYWVKFRQFIHHDKKTDTYRFDPEFPKKARISFEKWLKKA